MELFFIGWLNEGGHDKVWVSFRRDGEYFCCWGRRGKTLSFKHHPTLKSLMKVENKKRKTYRPVDALELFTLFPDLEEMIDSGLFIKMLEGKVK